MIKGMCFEDVVCLTLEMGKNADLKKKRKEKSPFTGLHHLPISKCQNPAFPSLPVWAHWDTDRMRFLELNDKTTSISLTSHGLSFFSLIEEISLKMNVLLSIFGTYKS